MSRAIIRKLTQCPEGKEEANILAVICTGTGHKATLADIANIQKYIPGLLSDDVVASLPAKPEDKKSEVCSKGFTPSVSAYLDRIDESVAKDGSFEVNKHIKFVKSREDHVSECTFENLIDYQYARVGDVCLEISIELAEQLISTTSIIANVTFDLLAKLASGIQDPPSLLKLIGLDLDTPLNGLQKRVVEGVCSWPIANTDDLSTIREYYTASAKHWNQLIERLQAGEKITITSEFASAEMRKGDIENPSFSPTMIAFSYNGYSINSSPKPKHPVVDAIMTGFFCRRGWSKLGFPA